MADNVRVEMADFAHIVEDRAGNQFYPTELGAGELPFDEPDE